MFSDWKNSDWIVLWMAFLFLAIFLILKVIKKEKNNITISVLAASGLAILFIPILVNFNFMNELFGNLNSEEMLISILIYVILFGAFILLDKYVFTQQQLSSITTNDIAFIALMVSLSTVLIKLPQWMGIPVSIPIAGNSKMVIGIGWIPVIIGGFALGPVKGFILGLTRDTVGWMIGGYAWHYLQAIQEPIVGFVAGVAGLLYVAKISKFKLKMIHIGAIASFALFVVVTLLLNNKYVFQSTTSGNIIHRDYESWYVVGTIIVLLVFIAGSLLMYLYQSKRNKEHINIIALISATYIIVIIINSFVLSPLYYLSRYDVQYQYSLIPRILKEGFILPIKIFIANILVIGMLPVIKSNGYLKQTKDQKDLIKKETTK